MKFFHLSDLHIGLKLYNRDLLYDQEYVLDQIVEAAGKEQPDAVVIAGDLYDKAIPSAEAVECFDAFLSRLVEACPGAELMMISGNHDSAPRLNLYRSILKLQKVHMIGMPPQEEGERIEQVTLRDAYGPVHFYLLPFVKPSMVKPIVGSDENGNNLSYNDTLHRLLERETVNESERNVLVSHQFYLPVGTSADAVERMDGEVRTVGNIDEVKADFFARFDYVALGHIHKPMAVGSEFCRYAGTPLPCSVSEAGQQKGIILVEMEEKGTVHTRVLPLLPRHEIRVIKGTLSEVLRQSCSDYVRVVLTDKVDLDVFDMQDRIRSAFPNLLEITRETVRKAEYRVEFTAQDILDPFDLCCSFLKDLDEEEKALLRDVISEVQGGTER